MKTRVSKAYRAKNHVGWKKTVGGHEWFLVYGTSPADEARAITLAEVLEAKWMLIKVMGGTELSQTDFAEAKDLIAGQPRRESARRPVAELVSTAPVQIIDTPAPAMAIAAVPHPAAVIVSAASGQPRRWLHASIDEFIATTRRALKADSSNGDYVFNLIDNIGRAREAMPDVALDLIRRKELEDWLLTIRSLPSKFTKQPLGAVTIRNIVAAARVAMTKFAEWEWWVPPPLWERAFKGYSIKKLQTPAERKRRRQMPPAHSLDEKRVLWHLSLYFARAVMAMADWAGHTQKEIATLTFDEVQDDGKEMYIDRDRHKTGVHGRWWIPPEAAVPIRRVMAETPRHPSVNPGNLVFLTSRNMPLVHRAVKGRRARSDYVGNNMWRSLTRAAGFWGVKHVPFKYMRKATAQLIRDEFGKEVSRTFLAHADEDIQDESYTRASVEKVERAMRALYPKMQEMFQPIPPNETNALVAKIKRANGIADENDQAARGCSLTME